MTESKPPLERRAYLGVDLAPSARGALVTGIELAGSAELAGIERGDVISKIGRHTIRRSDDVLRVLRTVRAGQTLEIEVERDGRGLLLSAHARAMPLEKLASGDIALDELPTPAGRLRALLSLPAGDGPFPAVYLLQGAGWSSFEHRSSPARPFGVSSKR